MAKDIDFEKTNVPEEAENGKPDGHESPFVFEPMRRKLKLRESGGEHVQPDCM